MAKRLQELPTVTTVLSGQSYILMKDSRSGAEEDFNILADDFLSSKLDRADLNEIGDLPVINQATRTIDNGSGEVALPAISGEFLLNMSAASSTADGTTLGSVKLSDSVSNASDVNGGYAATPKAVKTVQDSKLDLTGGILTGSLTISETTPSLLLKETDISGHNAGVRVATGDFQVIKASDAGASEGVALSVDLDGPTQLKHNVTTKLETTSTGVSITGDMAISNTTPTQDSHATSKLYVDDEVSTLSGSVNGKVNKSGDTMTGQLKINTTAPSIILNETDTTNENVRVIVENSDLKIQQVDDAGAFVQELLTVDLDGATTLSYDGVDKLLTQTSGIQVQGKATQTSSPSVDQDLTTKLYVDGLTSGKVDKSGDTMTGQLKGITPVSSTDFSIKSYVDGQDADKIDRSGDTMTGQLKGPDPVDSTDYVTKSYGDLNYTGAGGSVISVDDRQGIVTLDDLYVDVTGDTMTGPLTLESTTPKLVFKETDTTDQDASVLVNNGKFEIQRISDSGAFQYSSFDVDLDGATSLKHAGDSKLNTQTGGITILGDAFLTAAPTSDDHLTNKLYVDTEIANNAGGGGGDYVLKAGDTMTGQLKGISPVNSTDFTIKSYVDDSAVSKVDKSGDTMLGQLKGITPVSDDDFTVKSYVDASSTSKVEKSGDTMTGQLKGISPVNSTDFTIKSYVDDSAVSKVDKSGDSMYGELIHDGNILVEKSPKMTTRSSESSGSAYPGFNMQVSDGTSRGQIYYDISNKNVKVVTRSSGGFTQSELRLYESGRLEGTKEYTPTSSKDFCQKAYVDTISDLKYKENVVPLVDALSIIKLLDVVEFDWKAGAPLSGHSAGLIAQDVDLVNSDLIFETLAGDDELGDPEEPSEPLLGAEGYLSLNMAGLLAHALRSIQQLEERITALENP